MMLMVMLMVTMVRRRTFSGDYGEIVRRRTNYGAYGDAYGDDGEKEDVFW